jgi:CRISPR-associated protein (TIGR03986 family)
MAALITGKLLFDQEKRKWQVEFFNEKKQQPSKMFCDEAEISADIPKNDAEQLEVQFERKPPHGEPIQIRLAGKDFVTPAGRKPTPPTPIAQKQWNAPAQRERREQRPEGTNDRMPREFHNPYNFVPAVPRDRVNGTTNDLGDKPPAGHDRFHAELLSGRLHVHMTVKAPLLLLDTARVEIQDEHKTYPVREDAKGMPVINPTAIKGMLRSAYEAVTNSRLSVFKEHDERLAFRMESTEGAMSVPARIENGKIVLYTGSSGISNKGRPLNELGGESNATLCAAWLPMNQTQRHGSRLFAWLEKIQHINKRSNNPDFKYWHVRMLAPSIAALGSEPTTSRDTRSNQSLREFIKAEGFVCNTGDNIKNKHDERFFFIYGKDNSEIIKIDFDKQSHGEAWDRLIKNYRQEHSEKNGELKAPPKAEKYGKTVDLEWSRHVQRTEFSETSKDAILNSENLAHSPLCYARIGKENGRWKVEELYPVTISRRLHKASPQELLPKELHPTIDIEKLSPADHVFGWVRQGNRGSKQSAYRGQVRIGAIECKSANSIAKFDGDGLPLQILGQPKPQQGRFYVAETTNGEAQPNNLSNEDAGYKNDKGLRGRKVYPHHKLPKEIEKDYWDNPLVQRAHPLLNKYFQEFRRPDGDDQRDKQNRSVKGWVKPETVFKFDIHFINLSKVELGALIWLLDLPKEHFHRFGGGKPLGFGSVALALDGCEVLSGVELKKRYFALDEEDLVDKPQPTETKACLEAFETAINSYPDGNGRRILQSFLASARGFDKPIHYPRTTKEPYLIEYGKEVSASFNWFVVNNGRFGHKLALPDIYDDNGFPLKPED